VANQDNTKVIAIKKGLQVGLYKSFLYAYILALVVYSAYRAYNEIHMESDLNLITLELENLSKKISWSSIINPGNILKFGGVFAASMSAH